MSDSDSDIDVNDLDYDIHSGSPQILENRHMRIRLIWPLNFYFDTLTSILIANLHSDDVEQSIAAYYRLLLYVRESDEAAKEQATRQFFLRYAVAQRTFCQGCGRCCMV